ncbi:MAG: hypothetical protein V1831_00065 [Candidatus Woesearchaeota archaeon]
METSAETKIEKKEEKKSNAPICCDGCVRWERFGKNCHYYWEGKKECTMRANDWDEAAMQQL